MTAGVTVHVQEQHWALQHEAMEGLLLYIRSPKAGDFRQILPRSLYNPGQLYPCKISCCGYSDSRTDTAELISP